MLPILEMYHIWRCSVLAHPFGCCRHLLDGEQNHPVINLPGSAPPNAPTTRVQSCECHAPPHLLCAQHCTIIRP
eukprot:1344595-Amphidinium_carterae.1